MCHYRCWFSLSSFFRPWGLTVVCWQRSNMQQLCFPAVPIQEHMGCRNKAANTLGCSLLLAHSREAQWGYLKWQLAATADYTSSPRWSIIKEKKKSMFFRVESSMWKPTLSLPNTPSPFPGSLQKSSTVNKNLDATVDIAWQKGWQ